ncbi:MAG: molybdopterin-dependent oxidoreductase [Candidatus Kapaibacteriales bacterium]
MPHIFIDGKLIEAKAGQTIIQAAYENGIDIPHFCWHPELSISGNCRMCLVEVGFPKRLPDGSLEVDANNRPIVSYFPKLQIACATEVSENMYVLTSSERVIQAREAIMEFLLINHPLDCPICDEAGQCKLQEYAFLHSRGYSRFDEMKNRKDKRIIWGPNVIFDAERCILCSRCIRFAKEIAKQDVLTFVKRGDRVTIKLSEGTQFDNNYSMNVIDICPVGALTSRDFRFKSRVWDMSFNDSICPECSRGCNIKIGVRNNEILRIEPRPNPYVNRYWMCDFGRLNYKYINENRITYPLLRKNGVLTKSNWVEAISSAVERLKPISPNQIMFVASPRSTTENNYALLKFAKEVLNANNIDFVNYVNKDFEDKFLRTSDKSANSNGLREIGILPHSHSISLENLILAIRDGKIKAMFVMEEDFSTIPDIFNVLADLDLLIALQYNFNKVSEYADIILPVTTFAEMEGTFVNVNRRVQHFTPALVTAGNLRFMGLKMSRLDKFGAYNDRWTQHEIRDIKPSWVVIQLLANKFNAGWSFQSAEAVFLEIAQRFESFRELNYEALDEYGGIVLGRSKNPDPKVTNYISHHLLPY